MKHWTASLLVVVMLLAPWPASLIGNPAGRSGFLKGIAMVWDLQTMERLNQIAEGRAAAKQLSLATVLLKAIDRSAFDLAPCRGCGELVVCLPDGLPYCEQCGKDGDG